MPISFKDALAEDILDLITAAIDAGATFGTLKCYTAARPASADDAATGTLLATFNLVDPVAAAAAAKSATWDFSPAIQATVVADGTAAWFRVADSNGVAVFDGDIGTPAVPKDLNFHFLGWLAGGTVTISAGTTSIV